MWDSSDNEKNSRFLNSVYTVDICKYGLILK